MSERGIIVTVVLALLAVAFFFPYENSDDEYYRTHAKKPQQKTQTAMTDTDLRHSTDAKGVVDQRIVPEEPLAEAKTAADVTEAGSRAADEEELILPDFTPLLQQIDAAKQQVTHKRGGFVDGRRLEATYVQMTRDSGTVQPVSTEFTASISFHADGSFTENRALSFASVGSSIAQIPAHLTGHYTLKGYTFTVQQLAPAPDNQPTHSFSICPIGGQDENGIPLRLYLDGNVYRHQGS